jgi:hypothetical protein
MKSMSVPASGSSVAKNTSAASSDMPAKKASKAPLPPIGPIEISVVVPPERL